VAAVGVDEQPPFAPREDLADAVDLHALSAASGCRV
jgi:hypothetical protein